MKICVLIKQVPSADSPLRLNDAGSWIQEENVTFTTNESDAYALEEALQIKEREGEGEVVVASLGPDRVQRAIREALSKGADRGIHIQEAFPYITDPLVSATLFASVLRDEEFHLILSGLQSDDLGMAQTGVILGQLLGMSTATLAVAVELQGSSVRVKRELESGWFQWVTMDLPASVTVQSGINTPRYPSLKGIMGAKKKEIRAVAKQDLVENDRPLQKFTRIYVPRKTKRTEMIEGEPGEVVVKLVDVLKRNVKVL
ncbi:MAG: electron transfer flavoprotein subunit beta/FixA family protein [Candidatus Neomarinimicrobiota bacterium]